ncbi:hypothetical protein [Mycobacterium paraense]|uniref:hypothetical protein n=1 Tax=Mycobacterium paraense TaxID=767916 RepID=UPI00111C661C|nr:hypothetical protein [Mycobacterium paraense]
MTLDSHAPQRVVSVVNAKKHVGYAYYAATVYELRPRRRDGVLTYRRCEQLEPHRSLRLAHNDAVELAARLDIPLWKHVSHNMTATLAVELADVHSREYDIEPL